jgi:hypothetical protein
MSAGHLLLVVGVGRSGTSLLTGILGQLGFHVPQPEVKADETNPRGFGEPRWVVDFHRRLMRERKVTVNDSRPAAWESTGAAADVAANRAELRTWLEEQTRHSGAIVVKDPRTVWYLPLWMRSAAEVGLSPSFVTMLRHPAEVVASAIRSYGTWQTGLSRTASWINVSLETERLTRDARRAFVRYEDLLSDWDGELRRAGALLGFPRLAEARRESLPEVDAFVDPTLRRSRADWDELEVYGRVREMAEDVWGRLQPLAAPAGDTAAERAALDEAHAAYAALYAEAESIAQSSIAAATKKRRGGGAKGEAPTLRVRLARRVPVRYRRRLRRALRSVLQARS